MYDELDYDDVRESEMTALRDAFRSAFTAFGFGLVFAAFLYVGSIWAAL